MSKATIEIKYIWFACLFPSFLCILIKIVPNIINALFLNTDRDRKDDYFICLMLVFMAVQIFGITNKKVTTYEKQENDKIFLCVEVNDYERKYDEEQYDHVRRGRVRYYEDICTEKIKYITHYPKNLA